MKTISKLRLVTTLVAVAAFILVLDGCKKSGLKADTNARGQSDLAKAKAYAQQKSKEWGGLPLVFPVHQKMDVYWGDKNGVAKNAKNVINNANSSNCNDYSLPDYANMLQYQRTYLCFSPGPGYLIQWEYNVSWHKAIVASYSDGSISTEGYMDIFDDNGDVFVVGYQVTGSDVVITNLGTDPNNSSNNIYNVKFNYSTPIPTAYINGNGLTTYTVRLGATFVSDCDDFYALWITPVSGFGFTGNTGLHPCDRNDKPIFIPPSVFLLMDRIGIIGYDPTSSCVLGSSFVRTDLQQVEYSLDDGLNWNKFVNDLGGIPQGNPILADGYIRKNDYAESIPLHPGTYTVIIRYKNWKYNTYPNPLTIPTNPPDCHSPGNPSLPTAAERAYAEWAYEYWPLIDVY